MRIKIIGENDCARATRGLLRQAGFAVTEFLPSDAVVNAPQAGYVLTIETHAAPHIALDSADSPLEAAVLRHIAQLSKLPVIVDRPGGVVHSDRELRILAPVDNPDQATAVEYGILRGLLDLAGPKLRGDAQQTNPPSSAPRKGTWLGRLLPTIFYTAVAALPPAFLMAGVALATLSFPRAAIAAPAPATPVAQPLLAVCRSPLGNKSHSQEWLCYQPPLNSPRTLSLRTRDSENNLLALAISPSALFPQLQQGTSQVNLALVGGAAVSSALYDSSNNALLVHCVVGCTASAGFSDNSAFTVGSTAINVLGAYYTSGSAPTLASGDAGRVRMDANSYLFVDCVTGCSATAGFTDNSAFTAGTTTETNIGGVYNDSLATLSSGNAAAARLTSYRALHINLRNSSGTEIGTSGSALYVQFPSAQSVSVSGTPSVSISGTPTVTANAGSGTFSAQDAADGSTGSAVPSKAIYVAGKNSAGNLTGVYVDPCEQAGRSVANINLTASGQIISGSNYTFVCSVFLVTATAQNIAFVEGTGTTCATSTAALAGGSTAATGQNWAANGGFTMGTGQSWIMKTATSGDNICVLLSGTGQTSGNVTYVQLTTAN
jgi:hypothetical protein